MTRATPRRLLLAALLTVAALVASAGAAAADPSLGQARDRAEQLRTEVDRLQVAAEAASEDYNAAQEELGTLVARHVLAQQQLDTLRARFQTENAIVDDRVRALYMTGGSAGMLNSLLEAGDVTDAVYRAYTVSGLVDDGRERAAQTGTATRQAAAIRTELATLADQQLAAEKKAADAARRVEDALATRRHLLAVADAEVRRLAEEQRRAERAAAQRAFAARIAGTPGLGSAAPSQVAAAAVAAARTRLGRPYVWGATGPHSFDCSGLTGWAYRQAGLSLPRTSRQQWHAGPHVELADLAPGDLLFWATDTGDPATIHHVALYIGDGLMIAAPQPGDVVKVQRVYLDGYIGAVRPTAGDSP